MRPAGVANPGRLQDQFHPGFATKNLWKLFFGRRKDICLVSSRDKALVAFLQQIFQFPVNMVKT
jgi:hypothetical protein